MKKLIALFIATSLSTGTVFAMEAKLETELKSLADKGNVVAAWRLAKSYLDEEVTSKIKPAYSLLLNIIKQKQDAHPLSTEGRAVAQSFVTLGKLYLKGEAPEIKKPDLSRAKELFQQAAVYYGDSEGQYQLARLLLLGYTGMDIDVKSAVRWLKSAADKSHPEAQAQLGYMLFQGKLIPRQASLGLMYLTLAREAASEGDTFIKDKYIESMANASDDERLGALKLLEKWVANK